jgi:hypothetical protein
MRQRWHRTNRAIYTFLRKNHELGTVFFLRIMSVVKGVQFDTDKIWYIILRGRWCNIIVLNNLAPTEDKSVMRKTASTRN